MALEVKNLPANAGNCRRLRFDPWVRKIPGGGDGNRLSILAARIPRTEEPGGLQSMALQSRP